MLTSLLTMAVAILPLIHARPGMGAALNEILSRTTPMTASEALTPHPILSLRASGSTDTYTPPGPKNSPACAADTCCIWSYIASDLRPLFTSGSECSALARGAIRLGFHDSSTWNASLPQGGADGSILFSGELARPENNGLQGIAEVITKLFETYKPFGVSAADLIQTAATLAAVTCPGGPRITTLIGRKDSNYLPPTGLLPDPNQSASALLALFGAKTISPAELVALLGAHSVSTQRFVNPRAAGAPQDSTPGKMDTLYYGQTAAQRPPRGVFRFRSDVEIANDARTKGEWESFEGEGAQARWAEAYAKSYLKMSLLGVKDVGILKDCTKVLPLPR